MQAVLRSLCLVFVAVLALSVSTSSAKADWAMSFGGQTFPTPGQACDSYMPTDGLILPLLRVEYVVVYDAIGPTGRLFAACYYQHFLQAGGIRAMSAYAQSTCPAGQVWNEIVPNSCINSGDSGKQFGRPAPDDCCGNPINVAIGNKYQEVVDYSSGGPDPLQLIRYYNSRQWLTSDLGLGWRNSFSRNVGAADLGSNNWHISFTLADGKFIHFAGNTATNVWNVVRQDTDYRLTATSSTLGDFDFTDGQDTVESYTAFVLSSITYRNGYKQTIARQPSGDILVTDNRGRSLTLNVQDDRVIGITEPSGKQIRYDYDNPLVPGSTFFPNQRLTGVTYPDDDSDPNNDPHVTYHYEDTRFPFALTGITDEKGVRFATWTYDAKLRATSSEHAGGAEHVTVSYNDSNDTRTITNALGEQTIQHYQVVASANRLVRSDRQASAHTAAASMTISYNSRGYIASRTDWNGVTTNYTRDTRGMELTRTEAAGTPLARTITTTWHPTFHVPTQIDEPGRRTVFTYNSNGQLLTRTVTDLATSQARTWTYSYLANGEIASIDGPRTDVSDVATYAYDASDRLQSITNALGQVSQILTYDGDGRVTRTSDANGIETGFTYDVHGRLTSRTLYGLPHDATQTFEWDAAGNLAAFALPGRSRVVLTYDDARRRTRLDNAAGEHIDWTLDALGDVLSENTYSTTGTLTRTWTADYDELGRLLHKIGAASQTTAFTYDANGNLTALTDPRGGVTARTYDALNRLTQVTDAASGITHYGYDARDNLTSVTDPRSVQTTYGFDAFSEIVSQASPDIGSETYAYDSAGNLIQRTDAGSIVTNFAYDALNRITARQYPAVPAQNQSFTYDDATVGHNGIGRLSTVTDALGSSQIVAYDNRGNPTWRRRTEAAQSYDMQFLFDDLNALQQVTYPSGRVVSYLRDGEGRVDAVQWQENAAAPVNSLVSIGDFWPFGPAAHLTYGNGLAASRTLSQDYWETERTLGTLQDLALGYDASGNITSRTDAINSGRSESYTYDGLDRLTAATGDYGSLAYSYDANGNRQSRTINAATDSYSYTAGSNRLSQIAGAATRTFTYAASGELASDDRGIGQPYTFALNPERRLASVSANGALIAAYSYDGLDRRIRKTLADGTVTKYAYTPDGRVAAELDQANTAFRETVYLDGVPLAELTGTPGTSTLHYLHSDQIGQPRLVTDAAGAVLWDATFQPFGNLQSATGSAPTAQRFPGQLAEADTGLAYNYYRDYDSSLGRYIQPDPIGLRGGLNRFAYVGSNPLTFVDSDGTQVAGTIVQPPLGASGSGGDVGHYGTPANKAAGRWLRSQLQRAWRYCFGEGVDCEKQRKKCNEICLDAYVKDKDALPGEGHDYAGRMRRCIRECIEANGCKGY